MKLSLIVCLSLVLGFCSCKNETVKCSLPALHFAFVGFADSNLLNAYVLVYDGGSGTPIDSEAILSGYDTPFDTIRTSRTFDPLHNFKVVLPAIGASYSVTDVMPGPHVTQTFQTSIFNTVDYGCINTLTSYKLDGLTYQVTPTPGSMDQDYVYIHK